MSKFKWVIFAAVTIGILGVLVYLSIGSRLDVSTIDATKIQSASEQNGNIADHVFGKVDSPVVLIEYGDFQCPGCGSAHPRVKAITEEYKNEMQFVFRNFPLTSIHPNAKAAAGAVEAAGLQGKYWDMHNKVFETQSEWSLLTSSERTDRFLSYAMALGLNADTFSADLASEAINKKIKFDQAIAAKIGVTSTPTFYLNGVELGQEIWGDDVALKAAIDSELQKAGIDAPQAAKTE
ncbi:MAG TPA: thioredoxin domain-containing protein [Candidatus Saccharimonadales bacterium]|nr:thioredoxin domain-containing protein [Candidatus Saccharimonadales bacterium]